MRKLLNTLYVTSDDVLLSLENGNAVVKRNGECVDKVPLIDLEGIVTFSRKGATVPLMAECVRRDISVCCMTSTGSMAARVSPMAGRNVRLKRLQYRLSDRDETALPFARAFVAGKIRNARHTLERAVWDRQDAPACARLKAASEELGRYLSRIPGETEADALRGLEGEAAAAYYSVFGDLILNKDGFEFHGRSRRPPRDNVNAALSFAYTLLTNECAAALESVGFDPAVGFMHLDHPGRLSLACDLVEELRSALADRFVLALINNRELSPEDHEAGPAGAVYLDRQGREKLIRRWQDQKREEVFHAGLKEKIALGLVPYAQALALARAVRGEAANYEPFFRK